jgi:N-glycosylase/DNA lyase
MKDLISSIDDVRDSMGNVIDNRMKEFFKVSDLFSELCFCLLTANFNAARSIVIQKEIGDGFVNLEEEQLADELKRLGHRFPNTRARYIVEARKHKDNLKDILQSTDPRGWLVKNVKGLGMKEASHFLRNVGKKDYAIIDFHIIDLLSKHKLIERPNILTPNRYLKIEEILRKLSHKTRLSLGELDLYLWYLETGKILK